MTSASSPAPVQGAGSSHTTVPAPNPSTVRNVAFILTSNANGTDTLTLTMSQMLDPATLQQAFTADGIPALVKNGTYCSSTPAPPDPVTAGVLIPQMPVVPGTMVPAPSGPASSQVTQMAAHTATVINPAALPAGTELFFG